MHCCFAVITFVGLLQLKYMHIVSYYFAPLPSGETVGRAKYCNEYVCLFVCLLT